MNTKQNFSKKIAVALLSVFALTATQASEILKPVPMNTAEITKAAQLNIDLLFSTPTVKLTAVKANLNSAINTTVQKAKPANLAEVKTVVIAE